MDEDEYIEQIRRIQAKVIEKAGGTEAIEPGRALDVALAIMKELASDRRQEAINSRYKRQ